MLNFRNPKVYLENFIWIRNKQQKLQKLVLNPAQENLYGVIREEHQAGRPVRIIVLKGRQEGISTETEALMFQDAATRPLVNTLIMAHRDETTSNLVPHEQAVLRLPAIVAQAHAEEFQRQGTGVREPHPGR